MLPVSGKAIFSSRWWALVFAAGVCWTAVDVAGSAPHHSADANSSADDASDADTRAAAEALGNM